MDEWLRLCALTAKGSIPVQGTKILQDVTKKKKSMLLKNGTALACHPECCRKYVVKETFANFQNKLQTTGSNLQIKAV